MPLPATPETHLADEHFNNPELSDIVFFSDRDGGWEFHAHKMHSRTSAMSSTSSSINTRSRHATGRFPHAGAGGHERRDAEG